MFKMSFFFLAHPVHVHTTLISLLRLNKLKSWINTINKTNQIVKNRRSNYKE